MSYLDDLARTGTYEQIERQVGGMLHKWACWNIPGYDYDDLRQELRLVLYKCIQSYRPDEKTGREGRRASFHHFLVRASENRLGQLRDTSRKQNRDIAFFECQGCKDRITVMIRPRSKCEKCGVRRWWAYRLYHNVSAELVAESRNASFKYLSVIEKEKDEELQLEVRAVLGKLSSELRERAVEFLRDGTELKRRDILRMRKELNVRSA